MTSERFKVDLGGLVELLSKNLYSGPQVYVRELLQNAVDAITARREIEPDAPASVKIEPWEDGSGVTVTDTGIGLTKAQTAEFLATIGRTSKRDELLGAGRAEFLGQFGIGMLAAFLIADEIEVISRSALPDSTPVRWLGKADGTFQVFDVDGDIPVGSQVRLRARPDTRNWVAEETVVSLSRDYGSLLPFNVQVRLRVGAEFKWQRITAGMLPWQETYESDARRNQALRSYAESVFGFTPLAMIDLNVPLAGVSGVAFVLPQAVAPGSGRHRVYVKNMLVGSRIDSILPDWSFFVRAVVNADALAPTASREQLRDDEILLLVREALGDQIINWITATIDGDSTQKAQFISTHHLALRAMALQSDAMLEVVTKAVPFETTQGMLTLEQVREISASPESAEFAAHSRRNGTEAGALLYAATVESYKRIAPVARAEGLLVVNAGYVYDLDLISRLQQKPTWQVKELSPRDVTAVLELISPDRIDAVAAARERAQEILASHDCAVDVRSFQPDDVPAILLHDVDAERQRSFDEEVEAAGDLWDGLLASFTLDGIDDITSGDTAGNGNDESGIGAGSGAGIGSGMGAGNGAGFSANAKHYTRTVVFNDANATVRRLFTEPQHEAFASGVFALYLTAVMQSGEGLNGIETSLLNDSLNILLDSALKER
ncbi:HSP90 family protein [Arcanobacterium bovis]|uniref:HSP90 family protein n=1 Tax=Arcanobacterium bovis TaxID=2529275 RepID=A0A4Q9V294_9ACTO|nr:HSP90 family protein [Arcanobacterium bovis]TBW23761.1 HSP90 family protein [Arcanobacterium bovis]